MVDHDGVPKTDASFLGKYTLLYFGFTYCPDICPNELVKMGTVISELGARAVRATVPECSRRRSRTDEKELKVEPIFISIDPHRDSVHQIKNYLKGMLCLAR